MSNRIFLAAIVVVLALRLAGVPWSVLLLPVIALMIFSGLAVMLLAILIAFIYGRR